MPMVNSWDDDKIIKIIRNAQSIEVQDPNMVTWEYVGCLYFVNQQNILIGDYQQGHFKILFTAEYVFLIPCSDNGYCSFTRRIKLKENYDGGS